MPRVVLGVPLYRSEPFVGAALEALLEQDYPDFAVLAIDDCSPDATLEIAQGYAAREPRLTVEANTERLGMIGNWRRLFERAHELYGPFELFAWASDNDLRDTRWLSQLVLHLDAAPDAVIAYPLAGVIAAGEAQPRARPPFESRGTKGPIARLGLTVRDMNAGSTVYGLYRASALRSAGIVPGVLQSDILLLSFLSLHGTFVQVPEILWWRRRGERRSGSWKKRQRAALFAGDPPWTTHLPVWLAHGAWLAWTLVVRGRRPAGLGSLSALQAVLVYLTARWQRSSQLGMSRLQRRARRRRRAFQAATRRTRKRLRRQARRIRKFVARRRKAARTRRAPWRRT